MPQPVARGDARCLARPGALPRHVLAPLPGIWTHGDWASVDEDGYWFLHGRSDDTLNIAGKRIGPAELESAAIASGIVAEAAAVGIPHEVKGEVAWLFCVARPGEEADTERVVEAVTATSARRSSRTASCGSRRCRRRAARRSCGARCARRRWARIPETCRRWRIRIAGRDTRARGRLTVTCATVSPRR